MKFSKWNKPGTNETRIYINGMSVDGKPFITKAVNVAGTDPWEVKCFGLSRGQLDDLNDLVETALTERNGGERPLKFADVLALVGG